MEKTEAARQYCVAEGAEPLSAQRPSANPRRYAKNRTFTFPSENGDITPAEYRRELTLLERDYREAAGEAASRAYEDEMERW